MLLTLNAEAHLRIARIVHGEGASHSLLYAAVAKFNAVFGEATEYGLTWRQLCRIQRRLHHSYQFIF